MEPSFYDLSANEQAVLALLLALAFSSGLNEDQLNILGNFIEAVGQNILLIQAVVSSTPNASSSASCDCCALIEALRLRIESLEAALTD